MELLPESAELAAGEPKYEPDEVRTIKQGAVHVYRYIYPPLFAVLISGKVLILSAVVLAAQQ